MQPHAQVADGRRLNAGIVGTGFIGRVHARSALLAGANLAGVVASTPERGVVAAAEIGAVRGFGTADELIASKSIDVVHICTPNNLHLPLALAAIDAGKHVVVEKPVALDVAGAARLAGAADDAGVVATVPFAYRYYPTVREARARARAGIGDLRLLHGGYLQDWLLGAEDDNWRVDAETGGPSRAFADIGSHWCDLIEFVSGQRIASLSARTSVAHSERSRSAAHSFARGADGGGALREVETEDIAALIFETDGGIIGTAVVSQVSAGRKNHLWFELSGSAESVYFDQERPENLWVGRRRGSESIPRGFDTLSPEAAAYVTLPGGHPQGYQDCFNAFIAETYAAIGGDAPANGMPTVADGLRAAKITEAVLSSARSGEWVDLQSGRLS